MDAGKSKLAVDMQDGGQWRCGMTGTVVEEAQDNDRIKQGQLKAKDKGRDV